MLHILWYSTKVHSFLCPSMRSLHAFARHVHTKCDAAVFFAAILPQQCSAESGWRACKSIPATQLFCLLFLWCTLIAASLIIQPRLPAQKRVELGCIESLARSLGYHVPNSLHLSCFCCRRERQFQ